MSRGLGRAWIVAALLFALPSRALAQPEPSAEAQKAEARTHFERGLELMDNRAFDAALAEFLLSRKLHPTIGNTQNAAVCQRELGRFAEAMLLFEALLVEHSDLSASDRSLMEREIAKLKRMVGSVVIRAPAGAAVVVDGEQVGTTPLAAALRLSAGTRSIKLYKSGFAPYERRIQMAGGQTTEVSATLAPLRTYGRLTVVESRGRPAKVVVDNVVVGDAPWTGDVAPGAHAVALHGGGELGTQPVAAPVRAGETTSLNLGLEAIACRLRVEPTPANAVVSIDKVEVGRGAWEGRVRCGEHLVEVGAAGFLATSRKLSVVARKLGTAKLELEREPDYFRAPDELAIELLGGFIAAPSLGGDVAGCDPCERSPAFGALGEVRGSYLFPIGVTVSFGAGYLGLMQNIRDRETRLTPKGRPPEDATVEDDLLFSGPFVELGVGYRWRSATPFSLRLGAGALFGSLEDQRRGSLATGAVSDKSDSTPARYVFLSPEARLEIPLSKSLALSFSIGSMFLFAATQPRWDENVSVLTPSVELARYEGESTGGRLIVLGVAGAGVRASF